MELDGLKLREQRRQRQTQGRAGYGCLSRSFKGQMRLSLMLALGGRQCTSMTGAAFEKIVTREVALLKRSERAQRW